MSPESVLGSRKLKDSDTRLVALYDARKEGDVDRLIDFLKDPEHRRSAAKALGELGDPRAIEPIRPLLFASDFLVRSYAATALSDLGDVASLPDLKEMAVQDPHEVPRMWAVVGVAKLAGRAEVPFLISRLDDPHPKVRRAAAYALGLIGDSRAVDAIKHAKRNDSWRWRKIYSNAIDRIGNASEP
jgi:HEAT repeat protein